MKYLTATSIESKDRERRSGAHGEGPLECKEMGNARVLARTMDCLAQQEMCEDDKAHGHPNQL